MLTDKGDANMAAYGNQGLVRKVFLWGIAAIYLFAFSSLYIQIPGLYGRNGMLPAKIALKEASSSIWENFMSKPTLLWFVPHLGLDVETGMELLCLVGISLSLLSVSMETWRDSTTFFILWFLYYSLYQVGQTFLWFQWDILLMETGILTVLVAPLHLFPATNQSSLFNHHDGITFWLVKWLAFRLMFCSGIVKLSSQCPTWWGLTALDWHYESQCIPTPLAWYAHQLPNWFQRLSIVLVYVILIALSWLFFAPVRSLRIFSFYSQLSFQILIILTGNYNFFNLLAIVALLPILDDKHLMAVCPSWLVTRRRATFHGLSTSTWFGRTKKVLRKVTFAGVIGLVVFWMVKLFDLQFSRKHVIKSEIAFSKADFFDAVETVTPITIWIGLGSLCIEIVRALIGCIMERGILSKVCCILQWFVFSFAALGMFAISLVPFTDIDYATQQKVWPVIKRIKHKVDYLELVHAYGLFRSMTGVGGRPEVIVEGSNSIEGPWKEYDFLYKPGILNKNLPFVAPHQPRLDWQMWFAALGSYNHNPWFVHMVYRLLKGEQDVLDLLEKNPFPRKPPLFIRASLYKYHYTRLPKNTSSVIDAVHNAGLIKNWWKREYTDDYLPIVSLNERSLITWLNHFGYAKNEPWPEHPFGKLYQFIKYLRSIVRTSDPVIFILVLFLSGVLISLIIS